MSVRFSRRRSLSRAAVVAALLALAAGESGCAQIGDSMSSAFADPAKYELYDCKQLEAERKGLANRAAEQEGLMAKARTGVGGAVISEMAYRNELIAIHGQQKFADEAWRKNKCHETTPDAPAATPALTPTPSAKGARPRSGLH
ncbi:twin-arginine translocation pathway signal [Bradyrhizobium sp. ISRA443]|uniref:twin-arginine translocation pathway signal n=1 Tax=unclassified Bradyrhizobium TaxID=2631580 RepID=UPI0024799CD1|nr:MULTISPECIES: twin-arginine translocation pathway signal [unclassified Bradyrhizobium]WGR91527.1 twin-arginine translocation pathway signal [Bradyrhizobium sp. ISRA435]WGS01812.1 twin-arginine translocation pathway signal [Bradyrhizobium sp. ISRA436]WGS08698.1 twin-arginine translocation pathway signal [Bradyrhizobium sp. ISRA437]WGS15586.1 twin-arginine translocation pathway signal [Bradyrhizobium sp. ISRA443]